MAKDNKPLPPAPKGILALDKTLLTAEHLDQINTVKSGYLAIRKLVSEIMVEKIDWGKIPGVDKSVLFKAGAEKLAKLMNVSAKFECTNRIVSDNIILYEYKCTLINQAGVEVGECEGACNSKEEKYRYKKIELTREQSMDVDYLKKLKAEGKLSKTEYNGTPKYFLKEDRKDYYDIANTIMKMAEKRAFVGAVLIATGLSEFFTQDMEDFQQ